MDRSGAMPRSAWIEIRDARGQMLASVSAEIDGGTVSAWLPAFAPNSQGTIQLCTDEGGEIFRDEAELTELPTASQLFVVQMG
jgi:hypothetical protein